MKSDRILDAQDHITAEATEQSPAKIVPCGSVLVVTRSGILQHTLPVGLLEVDAAINQDLKALTPLDGIDSDYVAHALRSHARTILHECSKDGTTVHSVDTSKLLDFEIPRAPTPEQVRIVDALDSYLSRLDDAVASLERVQRNLKRYRAAVLQAAVEGRLVPTEAELARAEGRTFEPASELLARILTERRRRWEEAELAKLRAKGKEPKNDAWKKRYVEPSPLRLGDLPRLHDGWCWVRAEQVSEFITKGTTPSASAMATSGEIPFVKVYNLTSEGTLDFSVDPTFIDRATHHGFLERSMCMPGDILMNIVGPPLGKVAILPTTHSQWNINQAIVRYRPLCGTRAAYLSIYLRSETASQWLKTRAKATSGQFNLTLELCRELPVPLPPLREQERIALEVERLLSIGTSMADVASQYLTRCHRLRQSILEWAFEGKLVDQDPTDEPASVLLDRIRAERAAAGGARPAGRSRGRPRARA
jgi:type I restriction enzyme S subunit